MSGGFNHAQGCLPTIRVAREVMQRELQERCFDRKISNSHLVQLYMSKQPGMDAQKVLQGQYITAETLYMTYLREANDVLNGRDNFQKLILTQTPSLTWFRSWSTSSRTSPLSKISWTSTVRCSEASRQTKKTFSTVPTGPSTRTRTRTQVGDLD
jgi:hypothetical protein